MKIFKSLVSSLLSFLLFSSLSVLGLAFMLDRTLLNPDFVVAEINQLDVSSVAQALFSQQAPSSSPYLSEAIEKTIAQLEPMVKERVGTATHIVYDYLLGENQTLDLAVTLKSTILHPDFVVAIVDNLDMPSLARELLQKQLAQGVPPASGYSLESWDGRFDEAVNKAKPAIREQVEASASSLVDYLLGESQGFQVVISLEPMVTSLRDVLREDFLKSPPAELASLPPGVLQGYFDKYFDTILAGAMPLTWVLDEKTLGSDVRTDIVQGIAETEVALQQGRQYIGYFQLGYKLLLGFMVLLILGIILIDRRLKNVTRRLGTIFLTYGAVEYGSILAGRYFTGTRFLPAAIPLPLQTWLSQFLEHLLRPLEMFSLVLVVAGIVLIFVSIISRPAQPSQ